MITLDDVTLTFPDGDTRITAVDHVSLTARPGVVTGITGPSGSGKSSLLAVAATLIRPDSGRVVIDDVDAAGLSRREATALRRDRIGIVFQQSNLLPALTAREQLLVMAELGGGRDRRGDVRRRADELLDAVGLAAHAGKRPAQLSGGQRQRVALARALICEPRLVLLDEPLAALDLELRRQMQEFLKSIQREIKTTFLFVTHDQEEAIGMADRICVMESGRIRQLGTPHELYYRPSCEFVARFFGENNLVPGKLGVVDGDFRAIDTPLGRLSCCIGNQPDLRAAAEGQAAFAVFRPEALSPAGAEDSVNRFSGSVRDCAFSGSSTVAHIDAAGQHLRLRVPSRAIGSQFRQGETMALSFSARESHLVLA